MLLAVMPVTVSPFWFTISVPVALKLAKGRTVLDTVTVNEKVPGSVRLAPEPVVVSVSVELFGPVVADPVAGLNVPVTPVGNPVALKAQGVLLGFGEFAEISMT